MTDNWLARRVAEYFGVDAPKGCDGWTVYGGNGETLVPLGYVTVAEVRAAATTEEERRDC